MAESTWISNEQPILEAIRQAELDHSDMARAAYEAVPHLDNEDITNTIVSLRDAGFTGAQYVQTGGGLIQVVDVGPLTAKGRIAVGQWPPQELFDALLDLIDTRLASSLDDESRSKLEQLKAALVAVGTGAGGALLAQYLPLVAHLLR
jgi:hypothetical protein